MAIEIYKAMLELGGKGVGKLSKNEEHCIKIAILECSNLCEADPCRTANFLRAYELIGKVKPDFLKVKLRLEVVSYGVRWGVREGLVRPEELEGLMKEVGSVRTDDLKIKYVQAYCYYVYRELFYGNDWEAYREYTQFADSMFQSIYGRQET